MLDLLKKELAIHGVTVNQGNVKTKSGVLPVGHALALYKAKAKAAFELTEKLWNELSSILREPSPRNGKATEGIDNIFIHSLQGLKRMVYLFPGLSNFIQIENSICFALSKDINEFSYRIMSKIIEYKMAIEWVGHIIAKNLYIKSLIAIYAKYLINKDVTIAKGVHGPFSNLDIPMQERVFDWSSISDEVAGRENDKQGQRRYKMGLEGYNDPRVNEGFVWRELRNEPFLWGKEGENPYPHRNTLWS